MKSPRQKPKQRHDGMSYDLTYRHDNENRTMHEKQQLTKHTVIQTNNKGNKSIDPVKNKMRPTCLLKRFVKGSVNGHKVKFLIDSGSAVTVLDSKFFFQFGHKNKLKVQISN